jgi:hypothetical protein
VPNATAIGAFIESDNGTPLMLQKQNSTTSSTQELINLRAYTTGTAAAGFGGSVTFDAKYVGGSSTTFGDLSYKWTDAASATRTSKFGLKTMLNGSLNTTFEVEGDGHVNKYNIASVTTTDATPTTIKTIATTSNKIYEIELTVKSSISTASFVGVMKRLIRVKNNGGTVTILSTQTIGTDDVEAGLS